MFNHNTCTALIDFVLVTCLVNAVTDINVGGNQTELERSVTVTLEWDELNPLYSVDVTVVPEVQVDFISNSSARLTVAFNRMYNVTIGVSQPCELNDVIVFTKVYYFPCTSARECITCT